MPAIFMLSLNEFVDYSNNALFTNLQCNSTFVSSIGSSTGI